MTCGFGASCGTNRDDDFVLNGNKVFNIAVHLAAIQGGREFVVKMVACRSLYQLMVRRDKS